MMNHLKKALLAFLVSSIRNEKYSSQIYSVVVVLAIFYFLSERSKPYKLKRLNNLETLSLELIILTLSIIETVKFDSEKMQSVLSYIIILIHILFYFKSIMIFLRLDAEEKKKSAGFYRTMLVNIEDN